MQKRYQILADYATHGSFAVSARENRVSYNTARAICEKFIATGDCQAGVRGKILKNKIVKVKFTVKFCGVHRLGKSKQSSGRPRPVIARFTCREDRDLVWRQRYNLKGSNFSLSEDLPPAVRKIRKTILVPAMKEARKIAGTKATITGDRLIVNGKRYTYDQIPKKWNGNDES